MNDVEVTTAAKAFSREPRRSYDFLVAADGFEQLYGSSYPCLEPQIAQIMEQLRD